jgi:hypothetical protein
MVRLLPGRQQSAAEFPHFQLIKKIPYTQNNARKG